MLGVYIVMNSGVFIVRKELALNSLGVLSRLVCVKGFGGLVFRLLILSLGGLPPLFGFSVKFIALDCLVLNNGLVVRMLLVAGRLLSLFFYLRVVFKRVLTFFPQHSLTVFSWRRIASFPVGFSLGGTLVRLLRTVRLFGLLGFPVLVSFVGIN